MRWKMGSAQLCRGWVSQALALGRRTECANVTMPGRNQFGGHEPSSGGLDCQSVITTDCRRGAQKNPSTGPALLSEVDVSRAQLWYDHETHLAFSLPSKGVFRSI